MKATKATALQRFFWRCAVVDSEVMLDEKCPAIDRIKYAIIGALVCMTSTVATVGWMYKFSLILLGSAYQLPLSFVLGIGMGVLIFLSEQVLIASIPTRITPVGRVVAFSWRLVLAAFAAALMALPPALSYFRNEIVGYLDDKKLSLMAEKRKKVDEVFGLSGLGVSVENTERAIAKNVQARNTLPPHVIDLAEQSAACDRQHQQLRTAIRPRIEAATTERREIARQLESDQVVVSSTLRSRSIELSSLIAGWSRTLAVKAQACSSMAQQAHSARQQYYADLEGERQELQKRKMDQRESLDAAQRDAKPVLEQSDEAVRRRTLPDLSAQAQALYELAARNPFIRAISIGFYALFLMIDILPIIAKLTSRSIYERLLSAREDRLVAEIDAEVTIASAQAEIRKAEAAAEMAGSQRFYAGSAGEVFRDAASVRAQVKRDKVEVLDGFEQVISVVDAFEKANATVDDFANRHAKNPAVMAEADRIRGMLHAAMARAASILGIRFQTGRA